MTLQPEIVVHASADLLANAVAARLVTKLVDVQAARGSASVVLTGGRPGARVLRALRDSPALDAVDWRHIDIWWGDERWLPDTDPDRNDQLAQRILLEGVQTDPARVHRYASADGVYRGDPEAAAEAYAAELATAAMPEDHGEVPRFDVVLLGIGEEGHVASIFPGSPAVYDDRAVVAVRGCPKPPPTRLTMTLPTIRSGGEVWVVTEGESKAAAVALALGRVGETQVPAAGVRGRYRTLWLLDRAAASQLPSSVARPPLA
ncbi:MAG TPA: 6-phosphogluconolactonase [Mycobacteriales bacterium]|nr:6-phosphogluconolactonase [Mycobacteriales bacterium]